MIFVIVVFFLIRCSCFGCLIVEICLLGVIIVLVVFCIVNGVGCEVL